MHTKDQMNVMEVVGSDTLSLDPNATLKETQKPKALADRESDRVGQANINKSSSTFDVFNRNSSWSSKWFQSRGVTDFYCQSGRVLRLRSRGSLHNRHIKHLQTWTMDNLKCNILTCRTALTDKAVVVSPTNDSSLSSDVSKLNPFRQHVERFVLIVITATNLYGQVHIYSVVSSVRQCPNHLLDWVHDITVDCANTLFNDSRLCPGKA